MGNEKTASQNHTFSELDEAPKGQLVQPPLTEVSTMHPFLHSFRDRCSALYLPKVHHRLIIGPHLLLSTATFRGDKMLTETPDLPLLQPERNSERI